MTDTLATDTLPMEPFADADTLTDAVAAIVSEQICQGVKARGEAGIAIAGGTTPADLYRRLSQTDLSWDSVLVTLTDERWVDADSPESNERMIRSTLLTGRAAEARFVPLKDGRDTLEAAAEAASVALTLAPWPLDLVLLGMGDDAHFASLFPGNPALEAGFDPASPVCIPVPASEPAPMRPRLSLSLSAVLDSRLIVVMIRGEGKRAALKRAVAGEDPYDAPIRAILRQSKTPVRILWAP